MISPRRTRTYNNPGAPGLTAGRGWLVLPAQQVLPNPAGGLHRLDRALATGTLSSECRPARPQRPHGPTVALAAGDAGRLHFAPVEVEFAAFLAGVAAQEHRAGRDIKFRAGVSMGQVCTTASLNPRSAPAPTPGPQHPARFLQSAKFGLTRQQTKNGSRMVLVPHSRTRALGWTDCAFQPLYTRRGPEGVAPKLLQIGRSN